MSQKKIIINTRKDLQKLIAGEGLNGHGPQLPVLRNLMAHLRILRITDPDNRLIQWEVCGPDMIPDWIKNPDVMAELVDGMMAHDPSKDIYWYRAEHLTGGSLH